MRSKGLEFTQGVITGVLIALAILLGMALLLQTSGQPQPLHSIPPHMLDNSSDWVVRNLGYSLLPFSITLALYFITLRHMAGLLRRQCAPESVVQAEHLLDVWISLFFGIGVIWTAIGMRGALIYALGDVQQGAGSAIQVLARMVDGGMLTALSTTILGGTGGYLMRLFKTLSLGMKLNNYYAQQEEMQQKRIEILLTDIHCALQQQPGSGINLLSREKPSHAEPGL